MKLDKSNPYHWYLLGKFTLCVILTLPVRWFTAINSRRVILYGHKLNGNLLPIYELLVQEHSSDIDVQYLTMDSEYRENLVRDNVNTLICTSLIDMLKVAKASVIVTDHGPHALYFFLKLTSIPFIDVWHGIPFKGFDNNDFSLLHNYQKILVASESMKRVYIEKYGFKSWQLYVTGYARTDMLVNNDHERSKVMNEIGLDPNKQLLLIALTWSHQRYGESSQPFSMKEADFLKEISLVADEFSLQVIYRSHLNSRVSEDSRGGNVFIIPSNTYPVTEKLLAVTDIIVSDWSSIFFDYLLLHRPAIFIDRPCPFQKGFTYGPEFRFGPVVSTFDDMKNAIRYSLNEQNSYAADYDGQMDAIRKKIYGKYADGHSTQRCVDEIVKLVH